MTFTMSIGFQYCYLCIFGKFSRRRNRQTRPRRFWVHDVLRRRDDLGEYARLVQELLLDSAKSHGYFRMSTERFGYVLGLVGPYIPRHQLCTWQCTCRDARRHTRASRIRSLRPGVTDWVIGLRLRKNCTHLTRLLSFYAWIPVGCTAITAAFLLFLEPHGNVNFTVRNCSYCTASELHHKNMTLFNRFRPNRNLRVPLQLRFISRLIAMPIFFPFVNQTHRCIEIVYQLSPSLQNTHPRTLRNV